MNKPLNPHGRTRVITGEAPAIDHCAECGARLDEHSVVTPAHRGNRRLCHACNRAEVERAHVPRYKPKPFRPDVPLSHGKLNADLVRRLDEQGKRRRSGG